MYTFPLKFKLKWQLNSVCHGLMVMGVLSYSKSVHPKAHIFPQKEYGPKLRSVLFIVGGLHYSSICLRSHEISLNSLPLSSLSSCL